jgi:hypothetical protein
MKRFQEIDLDFIGNIYKQYCSNQITNSELLEYFPVHEDLKELVLSTIEIRKPQICKYLLDLNDSSNIPVEKSFNWDVKLITGDSSLSSYRNSIATIIFNCQKETRDETHSIELDYEGVNRMIENLEVKLKN